MFENPRRDRQAINFTTIVPKILDLKSSSVKRSLISHKTKNSLLFSLHNFTKGKYKVKIPVGTSQGHTYSLTTKKASFLYFTSTVLPQLHLQVKAQ